MQATDVAHAIRNSLAEGQLPCVTAFLIAQRFGATPLAVGEEADRLGVRLSRCQLGLFGYGPKAEGKHRRVTAMETVPPDMAAAIRQAVAADGKMSCVEAWRIANDLCVSKQTISDAAEGLGVRVGDCQLGAF
jgi:hypothetical protein